MRNTLSVAIAMAVCGIAHAETATFEALNIPGANAGKMSPNGAYIVAVDPSAMPSYRYTIATGQVELLADLASGWGINSAGSAAGAVYPDGGSPMTNSVNVGAYATVGGSVSTPITQPLLEISTAYGLSADGNTVVGISSTRAGIQGIGSGYVWTPAGGMKKLPVNRPIKYSRANGVSSDGHIIFGSNDALSGFRQGVIWVDGAPIDIGVPGIEYGAAEAISPNDQFVVGDTAWDATFQESAVWRWNRADGSVTRIVGMDYAFAVTNDGKTIVGNALSTSTTYDPRTALIWQEGAGTKKLVDWLAERGATVPPAWDANLAGGVTGISGDGRLISGWSPSALAPNNHPPSYLIRVTSDTLFADGFNGGNGGGTTPRAYMTFGPSTVLEGTPSTLTIVLDNPGDADATLTSDMATKFPSGLIVASTPNASSSCGSATLAAYPGYGIINLRAGAVIPAGGHCTVSVSVTSNFDGDYPFVIPAGVLSTSVGANAADAMANLHVLAGGNGIVRSGALNHALTDSATGTSLNFVTGAFNDAGPGSGDWDLNIFDGKNSVNTVADLLTLKTITTNLSGIPVDAATNNVVRLQPGDVVGPSTYFIHAARYYGTTPAWLAGGDGYFGVRFKCDGRLAHPVAGGFCYGYVRLQTTAGATGYPATLVSYAFDGDGRAITVAP